MPVPDEPTVVVRERTLDAPPEDVWETLTDELLLQQWLAADVELDLREGGRAHFEFEDGGARDAEIQVVRPLERLAWSWWDGDEQRRHVEFRLEPAGDGTRLVVVETQRTGSLAGARHWDDSLSALAQMHVRAICA